MIDEFFNNTMVVIIILIVLFIVDFLQNGGKDENVISVIYLALLLYVHYLLASVIDQWVGYDDTLKYFVQIKSLCLNFYSIYYCNIYLLKNSKLQECKNYYQLTRLGGISTKHSGVHM